MSIRSFIKRRFRVGLGARLTAGPGIALLLSMMLTGLLCVYTWSVFDRAREHQHLIEALHQRLEISQKISAERGPANVAMTADTASMAVARRALSTLRRGTDQALSRLGDAADRAEIRDALSNARALVDRAIDTPLEDRTPDVTREAIESMIRVAERHEMQVQQFGSHIVRRAPALDAPVQTAIALATLREHAGRLGSTLVPALAFDLPLSPAARQSAMRLIGYIEANWYLLQMEVGFLGRSSDAHKRLRREVEVRYLEEGLSLIGEAADLRGAGASSLSVAEFNRRYVESMAPLSNWRQWLFDTLLSEYRRIARRSLLQFLGVLSLSMLTVALIAGGMIRTHRRLHLPLMEASDAVICLADGRPRPPVQKRLDPVLTPLHEAIALLETRLIERDVAMRRLQTQAETDGLTALLNRRAFESRAHKRLTDANIGVLYLILVDVDHFKSINDRHGHLIGDEVLIALSKTLCRCAGEKGLVARVGGEEFALLLETSGHREIRQITETLLADIRLAGVETHRGAHIRFTASLGVACYRGEPLTALMERADRLLYAAKDGGRDRAFMDSLA